jgi:hypothetical protein
MKRSAVVKKMKRIKVLLHEYGTLCAMIKHMETPTDPVVYSTTTIKNCKKRLITIEETFDHLLK